MTDRNIIGNQPGGDMNWLRDLWLWLYIRQPDPVMRSIIRGHQREDQQLRQQIKRDLRDLT